MIQTFESFAYDKLPEDIVKRISLKLELFLKNFYSLNGDIKVKQIFQLDLTVPKLTRDIVYEAAKFLKKWNNKDGYSIEDLKYIELRIRLDFKTALDAGELEENSEIRYNLMDSVPQLAKEILDELKGLFRVHFSKKLKTFRDYGLADE